MKDEEKLFKRWRVNIARRKIRKEKKKKTVNRRENKREREKE